MSWADALTLVACGTFMSFVGYLAGYRDGRRQIRRDAERARRELLADREEAFWRGVDAHKHGSAYAAESQRPAKYRYPYGS